MALTLKLSKSITDYSILTLVDTTGEYDAIGNPGGWNGTSLLSTVENATLLIKVPATGDIFTIDIINELGIDFTTATIEELVYNIPSSMLGKDPNQVLDDGIYEVTYRIGYIPGGWIESEDQVKMAVATYFIVQSDVFKNVALIPDIYMCERCCTLKLKDIIGQHMMLQALVAASNYLYLKEFSNILETLKQIVSFDTELICNC